MYLVYRYKQQTNLNMFKEHIEITAFQKQNNNNNNNNNNKTHLKSCDYQATLEA